MNREELKEEAKRLGMKVRDNWKDDAQENTIILLIGIVLGVIVTKLFF